MKLNVLILAEALDVPDGCRLVLDEHKLDLIDVRLYHDKEWQGHLCLDTWDNLQHMKSLPPHVACIGGEDEALKSLSAAGCDGFVLPAGSDLPSVLGRIQDTFARFNALEENLYSKLLDGSDLVEVLNACALFFDNPTYIIDDALVLIASCDNIPHSEDDLAWKETASTGHLSESMMVRMKRDGMAGRLYHSTGATFFDEGKPFPRRVTANVKENGLPLCSFIVDEASRPLGLADIAVCEHVTELIASMMTRRKDQILRLAPKYTDSILRLLTGQAVDSGAIAYTLSLLKWRREDDYTVLKIKLNKGDYAQGTDRYSKEIFGKRIADFVSFDLDGHFIVILHHNPETGLATDFERELGKFLEEENAACGMSGWFSHFELLHDHYELAGASLELGNRFEHKKRLHLYADIMSFHLMGICAGAVSLEAVCEEKVLRLRDKDLEKGSNLLEDLYTYLIEGRSLAGAAKRLNIHRNTLVYRLSKIREVVDIDSADAEKLQRILFSCMALRYLNQLSQ